MMGIVQHKESRSATTEESFYKFQPYKLKCNSNIRSHLYQAQSSSNDLKLISPKPRSGHRVVCDDVHMYSFGGYNPNLSPSDEADLAHDTIWSSSKPLFRELWKYNISTSLWVRIDVGDIPDALASNAVLLSGHLLIVYGGTGVPFGSKCSNGLYICDLKNYADELKFNLINATGNCPQEQYGQAILLIDHYLYTIGGTNGYQYSCDIHRLNLKDNVWETVYTSTGTSDEPSGRYRHEVGLYDNKIFVLGGGTARFSYSLQVVFAFNLKTNLWEKNITRPDDKAREAYPIPRRCHSCVQHEQYVYVIGGYTGQLALRDVWRLDLNTFQWKKLVKLSLNRGSYFHSSCLTASGKMLTFGGIVQARNPDTRSSQVHSAWLCIPKLKEICWEAILFYYPDMKSLSESDINSTGLPYEFINRLGLSDGINKPRQSSMDSVNGPNTHNPSSNVRLRRKIESNDE